jgi:hypothetical protein
LALGLSWSWAFANVAPTIAYVGSCNIIGLLGSLITSSNTASHCFNYLDGKHSDLLSERKGMKQKLYIWRWELTRIIDWGM